tara:strand:- start:115 stop:462 length:348 start_codon:yes stop_codon:yes gene_type:complete
MVKRKKTGKISEPVTAEVIKSPKGGTVTVKVEMRPRSKKDHEPVIRWRVRQVENLLMEQNVKFGRCLKADFVTNDISGKPDEIPRGEWVFELVTKKSAAKKSTTKKPNHPNIESI